MTFLASSLALLLVWFVLPIAVKKFQIVQMALRCRRQRVIALTYDDGPGPRTTNEVLKILRSFGVKATFFMLGQRIDASRETADRLIADGHQIGSHSYRHFNAWKRDPITIFLDIRRGLRTVRALGKCRYFRAPYGKLTLASLIQVWMQGYLQSWWTIDSTDTWTTPIPIEAVLDEIRRKGGGVILLHDHDRSVHSERERYVLELTRSILEMARTEGFAVVSLTDILDKGSSLSRS